MVLSPTLKRIIADSKGQVLDGVYAAEVLDSSAETASIEGMDISDLDEGRGVVNHEHRDEESPGASPNDVIGKIVYAKKIMKSEDAEDERQKMYWDRIQAPYLYGVCRLYDGSGHPGAIAAAAQIRDAVAHNEPILCRWSIDGVTLQRDKENPKKLLKTIARKVALTIKPCNKVCDTGLLSDPNAPKGFEIEPLSKAERADGAPHKFLASEQLYRPMKVQHFSGVPDLKRLDPDFTGTGAAGAERQRKDKLPRVYLYTDPGQPEPAVTGSMQHHYTGTLPTGTRLYDMAKDRLGLADPTEDLIGGHKMWSQPDPSEVERQVQSLGYHGYRNYGPKSALVVFHPVDVTYRAHGAHKVEQIKKSQPSMTVGNAALSREDVAKRIENVLKKWAPECGDKRTFLKNELPDVSDEYLDHYEDLQDELKPRWLRKMAEEVGEALLKKDPEEEAEDPKEPLTHLGKPVAPNPSIKPGSVEFNERTGLLKTNKGTFQAYNPDDHGQQGKDFKEIWHSPEIREQHDYAMGNWIKLNQALKHGRLPEGVLQAAAAFSMLSPNTPVGPHELMFAHLIDAQRSKGVDLRDPGFGKPEVKADWLARDKPQAWPVHTRDYFEHQIPDMVTLKNDAVSGTGRKAGDRSTFMLPHNKFDNMAQYHAVHQGLVDLVRRHGIDSRSAVTEMMNSKEKASYWEAARKRIQKTNGHDIGDYKGFHIPGLAPKIGRFTYAMLGGGNSFVPDTHFSRHLFGLDKSIPGDSASAKHLKVNLIWNPKHSELLNSLDRWYYRNHPSVKYMLNHPQFGDYFKDNPEQAVFPAFWAHWLSIAGHERSMGHKDANVASNEKASHRPYFEEVDRIMGDPKEPLIPARTLPIQRAAAEAPTGPTALRGYGASKEVSLPDIPGLKKHELGHEGGPMIQPEMAAQLLHSWQARYGEQAALHAFYTHLLPLLWPEGFNSQHHKDEGGNTELLHKADGTAPQRPRRQGPAPVKPVPAPDSGGHAVAPHLASAQKLEPDFTTSYNDPKDKWDKTPRTHSFDPVEKKDWLRWHNTRHADHFVAIPSENFHRDDASPLNDPAHTEMVHGVNLNMHKAPGLPGGSISQTMFVQHPNGRKFLAKQDRAGFHNGANREVAYHRLAKDFFGLGHYVPAVSAFKSPDGRSQWSFHDHLPNAEHFNDSKAHKGALQALGDAGELHKLAFMNAVLGNGDRHGHNYMHTPTDPAAPIKLIDHGNTFQSGFDPHNDDETELPSYMRHIADAGNSLHPVAANWIKNLDEAKLASHIDQMGLGEKTKENVLRAFRHHKTHWLNENRVSPRRYMSNYYANAPAEERVRPQGSPLQRPGDVVSLSGLSEAFNSKTGK